jgi:arsenate reductase
MRLNNVAMPTVIYHNPACTTSRNVLAALQDAGKDPEIVDYLKAGWTLPLLRSLMQMTGLSARELLRTRGDQAAAAGLTDASTEDDILAAMVAHPVLVERPIVVTDKGAALVRPKEKLAELL